MKTVKKSSGNRTAMPVSGYSRFFIILLGSLLAVACQNKNPSGIRGTITNIHYVIWEQANDKPDAAFIRLDNGEEYSFMVYDRLPLQRGQRVIIQLPAQPLKRRIHPACVIIPLNNNDKALEKLDLRPASHCG